VIQKMAKFHIEKSLFPAGPLRCILIGIGTDVGKTLVATLLTKYFPVAYWKPIQSGAEQPADCDAYRVREGVGPAVEIIPENLLLQKPFSPHKCLRLENKSLNVKSILQQFSQISVNQGLIIETAGGLYCPLDEVNTNLDLVKALELPVILVSKHYLGSLNHTLMTYDLLKRANIPILGLAFVGTNHLQDEEFLQQKTGLKTLCTIDCEEMITPEHFRHDDHPVIQDLTEKDRRFVWHPFSKLYDDSAFSPQVVQKAQGAYYYLEDGRKIFDGISSWWVNIFGHGHPYLQQKLHEQFQRMDHILFAGFTHPGAINLAERLVQKCSIKNDQPYQKCFFSDNGSTAVEVALKMALQREVLLRGEKARKKILCFQHSYHGDTFGAMSMSERGLFNKPFWPYLFDVDFVIPPLPGKEEQSWEQFSQLVSSGNYCLFLFEPILQGSGGMLIHDKTILARMIDYAHQQEMITIADEVMTGYYRTGTFLACEQVPSERRPDLVCLSKGITGGVMPLGVTICGEKIVSAFSSGPQQAVFYHGHSYTANPLSLSLAQATLDLLEQDLWQESIAQLVQAQQKACLSFSELQHNDRSISVRSCGTIFVLEFHEKESGSTHYQHPLRNVLYETFLKQNILLRPLGNVLYLMPPYCITQDELKNIHQKIKEVAQQFLAGTLSC
jgi:adenosylmethionine-8-amino-7-oxononanoate aminotransferase